MHRFHLEPLISIQKAAPISRCGFLAQSCAILLVQTELLVEAADTAAGIDHLLLTGVEGMALGANLHTDVLLGGTSLDHVTASAADGGQLIVRMDSCLHYIHLFLLGGSFRKRICYIIITRPELQHFFRIFSKGFSIKKPPCRAAFEIARINNSWP